MSILKIALCQTNVCETKEVNLSNALDKIRLAASTGANLIVLPEMFICPYDYSYFRPFSESSNGNTLKELSKIARELSIYLVCGSIPEVDPHDKKLYNSSFVFDKTGKLIAKHRKIHLFDIDLKDGLTFKESSVFSPGREITVFRTEFCSVGLAICYDLRFPEIFKLMAQRGAEIILVPAAFNTTTGPAHWSTLLKCRAIDNQVYMAGISPARNPSASYKAYGHSSILSPWGECLGELDHEEDILYWDIDLHYLRKIRSELPILQHTKDDYTKL